MTPAELDRVAAAVRRAAGERNASLAVALIVDGIPRELGLSDEDRERFTLECYRPGLGARCAQSTTR